MDIQTLESLGISTEDLGDRIVEQAVDALLSARGFDQETGEETRYVSKFQKEVDARIQKAVDQKIAALAAEHLVPRVGELIERANMVKTNKWGEPKSDPMTFKEYLAYRAERYMTDDVDHLGNSKADLELRNESTYNWRPAGQRLTVLLKLHIKESMEKAAKAAVTDVNKALAVSMEKAAKDAIAAVLSAAKVSISA